MKETFLKVIVMLVIAVIAVPLLISMWPRETIVVKEDRALTNTVVIPNDWVEYQNNSLSFWHSPRIAEDTTVGVSGFTSVDDDIQIVTFADTNTVSPGTDAPFDGFTLYTYDLASNETEINFEELIGAEKIKMQENYAAMNGSTDGMPEITDSTLTLGEHEVTQIDTPFSTIVMYYLRMPNSSEILLFSGVEKDSGSFLSELEDIITTVEIKN